MISTDPGTWIDVSTEHPKKADSSIRASDEFCAKITSQSDGQCRKHSLQMVVTELGIMIF
jgi:hypothetical protein